MKKNPTFKEIMEGDEVWTDSPQVKKGNLEVEQKLFGDHRTIIRNKKTGKKFILKPKEGEVFGLYNILKSLIKTYPDKVALNKLGEQILNID